MPDNFIYPICTPPITRLPVELLVGIFGLCLPHNSHLTLSDPLKPSRVVSQVCMRWRAAALSTSRLWNEIALSNWRKKDQLPWIKELSHRSGNALVSLRLWIGDGWDKDWDTAFELLLLDLIPRIRVLDVRMDYALFDEANKLIMTLSDNNFPVLEFARIVPYNVCRTAVHDRFADFHFKSSMPKLRGVEYDLHFEHFTLSSFSGLTYFKTTFFLRYGNVTTDPIFSPDLFLELLSSMPLLQEVYLSVESDPEDEGNWADSKDPLWVTLPHLKHLNMHLSCFLCSMLIPYIIVGPGCTLDVTCIDSKNNQVHEAVRLALMAHVQESRLSMCDKSLEIDIQPASISVLVHAALPIPGVKTCPLFVFNTMLRLPEEDEEVAEGEASHDIRIQSIQYVFLMVIVRTIQRMKLTQVSGISLNIDVPFIFESISAPVLGPLLRACKSAKTLRLTGTKNAFMLPFLFNRMEGTGREFDELLFSELDYSDAGWNAAPLIGHSLKDNVFFNPKILPKLLNPESEALKTVNVLHTSFDMTTLQAHCHLANLLHWREKQLMVVDNLLWPVATTRTTLEGGLVTTPLTITMADMMHKYLRRNGP